MKKTLLKVTISVFLFTIILTRIDIQEVLSNLKRLDIRYTALILVLLITNYIVSSIRWKKLLIFENSENVSISKLVNLYFVGAFFNNFMPTSIGGDVYKVFKLGSIIKSKSNAFSATFMERFTGIIALVLISYYGLVKTLDFWIDLLPVTYSSNNFYVWVFKFLLFFGFWIAALIGFLNLKLLSTKITKLKGIYDSLLMYKDKYNVLTWVIVTSFIVQFMGIFTQYFIFKALGADISVSYALFVLPVITMASFFIPSLNGVGIQDALYIQFFQIVGVSSELALSASIVYHLFRLFVSLIGGVIYAFERDSKK